VDHVADYKVPKDHEDIDEVTRRLHSDGCAPSLQLPVASIKKEDDRNSRRQARIITPELNRVKRERSSNDSEPTDKVSRRAHNSQELLFLSSLIASIREK